MIYAALQALHRQKLLLTSSGTAWQHRPDLHADKVERQAATADAPAPSHCRRQTLPEAVCTAAGPAIGCR